jgi:nucleoside-diphosphate-sugar epimerase
VRPDMRMVALSSLAAREPSLSDYAASKRAGEQALAGLDNLMILRPPAVYGPGDRETGLFLRAAFGPVLPIPKMPQARICLIHAADLARAVAALSASGITGCLEVSDSRTDGYGWRELAEQIIAAAHGTAHIVELPAMVLRSFGALGAAAPRLIGRSAVLGPGKVRELLHADWASTCAAQPPAEIWQPRVGLAEGLAQTMAWLREREVVACAMN